MEPETPRSDSRQEVPMGHRLEDKIGSQINFLYEIGLYFKKYCPGTREIAQWLRTYMVPAEDLNLGQSTSRGLDASGLHRHLYSHARNHINIHTHII